MHPSISPRTIEQDRRTGGHSNIEGRPVESHPSKFAEYYRGDAQWVLKTATRAAAFAAKCNSKFPALRPGWGTATASPAGSGRRVRSTRSACGTLRDSKSL